MFLVLLDGLDAASELGIVAIDSELALLGEHRERQRGLQGLLLSIDTHDEPLVGTATCQDNVTAWIAIDEAHLVPVGGYLLHEVNGPSGGIVEVVGSHGEVLDAALEEDGRSEGIDIAGATSGAMLVVGIIMLVECGAAEVHRAHGVADEGVDTAIACLGIAGALSEVQVLGG